MNGTAFGCRWSRDPLQARQKILDQMELLLAGAFHFSRVLALNSLQITNYL
jgi:hypothetical protein